MITGALIAEIAALVGEPARATMLSALLDGRALTAGELAFAARVTPQTASTHLARLTEAGLISAIRDGRHRYFRLGSPTVVEMLNGIVAVSLETRPRCRPLSRQARELSAARICYDHLAGRISVDSRIFTTHEYTCRRRQVQEIVQEALFLASSGESLRWVQPAVISADCVSTGPSDGHTSRERSEPLLPDAASISAGPRG
jgi:DNA-binding transcriptional ArsR family regulator